tara:strand:+ start:966 stop:1319 length:354 start_codon:yes stop_codon:yes gene_type:complete
MTVETPYYYKQELVRIDTLNNAEDDVSTELLALYEEIFGDIETLMTRIDGNNDEIERHNKYIKANKDIYISLKDKIQGARGMQNDIQYRYNQAYYTNILIMVSIIGGFIFYSGTRKL